jgi:hypothetical protein
LFGDAFAPVTGLFTALALIVAARSVAKQTEQLDLQRKDLIATHDELELTRDEHKAARIAQQQLAEQQRRANALSMLDLNRAHLQVRLDLLSFTRQHVGGGWLACRESVVQELERTPEPDKLVTKRIRAAVTAASTQADKLGERDVALYREVIELERRLDALAREIPAATLGGAVFNEKGSVSATVGGSGTDALSAAPAEAPAEAPSED